MFSGGADKKQNCLMRKAKKVWALGWVVFLGGGFTNFWLKQSMMSTAASTPGGSWHPSSAAP